MKEKSFIKITDELYFDENREKNLEKYLVDKVSDYILSSSFEIKERLEESLMDCESPIEQLLSMELEWLKIRYINKVNPFIDIVDIEKQEVIECGKEKYRVDFLIPVIYKNQDNKCFVVECDGYEFHQKTKEQVKKDNQRMRKLQEYGYEVIRFSGTEIWHSPYKCAMEILDIILSKCKYIKEDK